MKKQVSFLLLALPAILILVACQPARKAAPTPSSAPTYGVAQVTGMVIRPPAAGEQQVTITLAGQLPDACTQVDRTNVQRVTGGFIVTVTTTRLAQPTGCAAQPAPFQRQITLEVGGLPGGAYTVAANGISQTFVLPVAPSASDLLTPPAPTSRPGTTLSAPTETGAPEITITIVPSQPAPPADASSTPTSQPTQLPPTTTPTLPAPTTAANQPTLPATTVPVTQSGSTAGCEDKANFEKDVTVPDDTVIYQGQSFVKTWRIYNAGTCTWGPGYSLVFAYGEIMQATPPIALPETRPGQSVEVSAKLTAPNTPGQYTGNWKLQTSSGQVFGVGIKGDPIWVQIQVSYIGDSSTATPLPAATAVAAAGAGPAAQTCAYQRNPDFESQVLAQINQIRATFNLKPLTLNSRLSAAALWYSADMACNNRVDPVRHTDSTGGRWYERISAQNYHYADASEIVWFGPPAYGGTPQAAINWWMRSPVHHAIILDPKLSEAGVGYAVMDPTENGYYTVDFAVPGEQ